MDILPLQENPVEISCIPARWRVWFRGCLLPLLSALTPNCASSFPSIGWLKFLYWLVCCPSYWVDWFQFCRNSWFNLIDSCQVSSCTSTVSPCHFSLFALSLSYEVAELCFETNMDSCLTECSIPYHPCWNCSGTLDGLVGSSRAS